MIFGELSIPSTRALWDDDSDEDDPFTRSIAWNDNRDLPIHVNTLIIVDTKPIIQVFKNSVIGHSLPLKQSTQAGLNLYKLNDRIYLLVYEGRPRYTIGEIIDFVKDLLIVAKNVYGITSCSIAAYQGDERLNEETCTIFGLATEGLQFDYPSLKVPNVITGICANALTYCICRKKPCGVFVGYLDNAQLDSLNTGSLLSLIKKMGVDGVKDYELKMQAPSNNLYM